MVLNDYLSEAMFIGPTGEGATLELFLGNVGGQMTDVPVGGHFVTSDQNSINFKIIIEKDRTYSLNSKLK